MFDRRDLLKGAGLAAMAAALNSTKAMALDTVTLPFVNGERPLVKYPQKRPMIGLTSRPPQLETPFAVFNDGPITANNAFFVRYHLSDLPYNLDPDKFTLEVKGKVDKPLKLSLKDIRKMKATEIVAVNQCSGNSRGFFNPRVAGGQLGNGAMGCARWRGVPLKAVLDMAGVQSGARQVTFNGMDGPVSDKTPDFVKALDIDHARDGEVMMDTLAVVDHSDGAGLSRAYDVLRGGNEGLLVAFLGLNGEEVRTARRLERRVGYYELSLRVTRRRLAFMLALFSYLVLVILGAITGLVLVILLAPPPPGQDSARVIDIAGILGGFFGGMLGAWAVVRRLLARVGRMRPDDVAALTKSR